MQPSALRPMDTRQVWETALKDGNARAEKRVNKSRASLLFKGNDIMFMQRKEAGESSRTKEWEER